ncbi:MAG: IclR family transcriptional regulator [Verrucomicrobiota bacterium JB022]|nr:IclR family transcriptional regulator [Verrucomicrobiota bacterium JB022]
MSTPDYRVPALEKGLDILEALAAASIPQSLTDLATRLDRSPSALFRMLNCLERRHYVMRDPVSGKYILSLKLYALAHTHSPVEALIRAARRPMQELSEAVRESCHLSVLDHGQLLVVQQQDSPEPVRISIEIGGVFDAAATLSGRLLLSRLPAERRAEALASSPIYTGWSSRERQNFEAGLAEMATKAFVAVQDETVEGVDDLAAGVGGGQGPWHAALTITRFRRPGAASRQPELEQQLLHAAQEITTQLGIAL